jgi:hypothetical protein
MADTKQMISLHDLLVDELIKRIKGPECPAAILKEARELLKDSGIEATSDNKKLKGLSENVYSLPFNEADEQASS